MSRDGGELLAPIFKAAGRRIINGAWKRSYPGAWLNEKDGAVKFKMAREAVVIPIWLWAK